MVPILVYILAAAAVVMPVVPVLVKVTTGT